MNALFSNQFPDPCASQARYALTGRPVFNATDQALALEFMTLNPGAATCDETAFRDCRQSRQPWTVICLAQDADSARRFYSLLGATYLVVVDLGLTARVDGELVSMFVARSVERLNSY